MPANCKICGKPLGAPIHGKCVEQMAKEENEKVFLNGLQHAITVKSIKKAQDNARRKGYEKGRAADFLLKKIEDQKEQWQ